MRYNESVAMVVRMVVGMSWMAGGVALSYWYGSGDVDFYDFGGPLRAFAAYLPVAVGFVVGLEGVPKFLQKKLYQFDHLAMGHAKIVARFLRS